jgi:hypothetical protein
VEDTDDLSWLDDLLDELMNGEDTEEEKEAALDLAKAQERLVEELVAQGSTAEDAGHWVAEFSSYTANEVEHLKDDNDELLALLDGPFKVLRDDTFPATDKLLVWDRQATPSVQALTFEEATERYKCGGGGSRWVPEDLETVKEVKRECLEETLSSYAKQEKDPDYEGVCSTPALVVSNNPLTAHRWCVVKACLSPEARGARQ